ncbi:MAG: HTH domain-containing protein [Polyangiales bacterium]
MTFTEAAVEVLRSVGKPLHYKKITEIAIERNLLSHVGKTPETTMSSRLATMVKKDRGDAPIVKVKPGVFALRELSEETGDEPEGEDETSQESDAPDQAEPELEDEAANRETPDEEKHISAQEHPGADVFPEEEDDDELILANLEGDSGEGRKPRKRRPRRRRERDSDGGPSAESRPERRTPPRDRPRREAEAPATRAATAGEPVGRDLSDSIETALRARGRQSRTLTQVAEHLIDSGRLEGSPTTLAPTLAAAIRGDNARRRASGRRPRFREVGGAVALLEWELPNDAVNAERDAVRAADRQRQGVQRALVKRMRDLPDGALLELLATWLNAVGVHSLRAVRADAGDFSLAGVLRRGPEETPLAITIYRGNQPIDKEAVIALRGGLHRFDHARVGWVITLGQVQGGTLEEAHAEGAAPCAVFDSDALAASMEDVNVGIVRASLPLAVLDVDLLDALGGGAARTPSSNHGSASTEESNEAGGSSKRRRGRRRGRRRSSREETNGEGGREDKAAAQTGSTESDRPAAKTKETETVSESAPEATEDIEKKAV